MSISIDIAFFYKVTGNNPFYPFFFNSKNYIIRTFFLLLNMTLPRLPIEKFDENGLLQAFYVNRFSEHLKKYHSDINHPHKHDFYLTVFFEKGRGRHDIDFNSFPIHPNSVFFLQPEQIHHWEFEEEPEGWIFFHSA